MKRLIVCVLVVGVLFSQYPVAAQFSPCQGRVTMTLFVPLNVRDGVWGKQIGLLYRGAGVDIFARDYDSTKAPWYQVSYGDGLYWIHGWYVNIETPGQCDFGSAG